GVPLFDACLETGAGLPADVLPLAVPSVARVGHDLLLAALVSGFSGVAALVPRRHRSMRAAIDAEVALTNSIIAHVGAANAVVALHDLDDPDMLPPALDSIARLPPLQVAGVLVAATKRATARQLLRALARSDVEPLALEVGAPYGALALDKSRCTLCFACASVCPVSALQDTPDRPALRFTEAACVQCGLCVATCPEAALALVPRLDLDASAERPRVLNEEPAALCGRCGKPFGTPSTIRQVQHLLARNSHFSDRSRLGLIELCGDCRVIALLEGTSEPLASRARPRPRTSEDYLT
ncbi:MAG: 4Fe-4S dicluster domain-containing protein, partial [Hyphomicrobiaceae bacterium]